MSSLINQVVDNSNNISGYISSCNNEDNESISEFISNNSGKYKTSISNILSSHYKEVKVNTDEAIPPIINISKKKLKELVLKHNNEIFAFMTKADKTADKIADKTADKTADKIPKVINLAETLIHKYGSDNSSIKGNISKGLNLDTSILEITAEVDDNLKKNIIEGGGLEDYLRQTKWLFNQYKTIGEEVLRLETILFQKVDLLDKLNSRAPMITSLENNEILPELINAFTKYAESVYKSINIEDTYKELIVAYKKWNICRQVISHHSNFKNETQYPQCAICLEDTIMTAIVPCGHTFCGSCIKKQNTSCYICRGTIRERIKLYFT
jgi:hypothetical protein